jgi:polar amino acid transport system substrate-binding protein
MRTLPLLLMLAACGVPRDPEGTLERVRQAGVIRVGVTDGLREVERTIIEKVAREQRARVEWNDGNLEDHYEALEKYELDLVAGGISRHTPWSKKLGATRPYDKEHVLAVPPGENAWLMTVERHLP